MNDEIMTADEVAAMLRVTQAWLKDHQSVNGRPARRRPYVPAVKFGVDRRSPVRFRRSDVAQFIQAVTQGAA